MAGNCASVAAVTHQAAIFFSDAQVSKQQREDGGVIRTRGSGGRWRPGGVKGRAQEAASSAQLSVQEDGSCSGSGAQSRDSEEAVLGDDEAQGGHGVGRWREWSHWRQGSPGTE